MKKIDFLYKWECVLEDPSAKQESVFFEWEKKLNHYNIKTRIEAIEEGGGYRLLVPLRDHEVARDLVEHKVRTIITSHTDYHVFHDDLSYRNKKLYEKRHEIPYRSVVIRNMILMLILLLIIFLIFTATDLLIP